MSAANGTGASRFGKLKKLGVERSTAWFAMPQLGAGAAVCGRPADSSNRGFINARMKRNEGPVVTKNVIDSNRAQDRELFARHVLTNWRGITDDTGKEVEFSADAAFDFCNELPPWLFDKMRIFFMQAENFLAEDEERPSAESAAGNSSTGSSGT